MIIWRLEVFDELSSTSTACLERAREGEPGGLAVMALRQTSGRGSRGRMWQAPEGNLNLSILLRPERPAVEAGMFALLAGIAVAGALEELSNVSVILKWPNDVLLNGAKLAGILIDAAPAGARLEWLVIGIGINIKDAPSIEGRTTTSLGAHGIELAPNLVADAVLRHIAYWQERGGAEIVTAWLARAHPIGTLIDVRTNTSTLQGSFAGLASSGELLLQHENRIEAISTGEVLLGPM